MSKQQNSSSKNNSEKTVIIGGGFYGLSIALFLRDEMGLNDIAVIEKESTMMSRASYVNQARVHNGYHYPRSILTAYRSTANFDRFVGDYGRSVVNDFDKHYAVAKVLSKVNARQFYNFARKIGADIEEAKPDVQKLFVSSLIEGVYKVKEYAFNSHELRDLLLERINEKPGIILHNNEEVKKLEQTGDEIVVTTNKSTYNVRKILNCSYSQLNNLHRHSSLPLLPLKHEIAEMALVRLPESMKDFSVTVMDGPFFSIMPFPSKGLHTLSHVRYTPHHSWLDNEDTPSDHHDTHAYFKKHPVKSQYKKMYADVVRYIPELKGMEYAESISEVKTVLQKSENDDSRPILFRSDFGLRGYACIMGGKLDNIYDVFDELTGFYEKG